MRDATCDALCVPSLARLCRIPIRLVAIQPSLLVRICISRFVYHAKTLETHLGALPPSRFGHA
jgi:hypothetical protein